MKIFGIAGWSGSGKTTLILGLIAILRQRGLRVSSIKHSHHRVDVDSPNDDSRHLSNAGAHEVLIAGSRRWALIHPSATVADLSLDRLAARFSDCDLLLAEGFKYGRHPKLEVYRPELGKPLLCQSDPAIVAVASTAAQVLPIPCFDLDNIEAIARFVAAYETVSLFQPSPDAG